MIDKELIQNIKRLSEFDTEDKAYFCVTYENNRSHAGHPISMMLEALNATAAPGSQPVRIAESALSLTIEDPQSISSQRTVSFAAPEGGAKDGYPVSLAVNSISAILTLYEPRDSGDTPTINVTLVMKDGAKENIFRAGWVGMGNGGGVALPNDPDALPLASGNTYVRDLEASRIVQTASFSRIIDPAEAEYVLMDGTRYDFNQ